MEHRKIFALPSKELLRSFILWFSVVFIANSLIYFPANSYAAKQTELYRIYANWELAIPLVPWMVLVYISYLGVFIVLAFVIKTTDAYKALGYSLLVTLAVSGAIFVLFPGHLGYSRTDNVPMYGSLFRFLFSIDLPYNLFPSLHVSFAGLCVLAMIHQTDHRWFHRLLKIWFACVCASVVLTHQHHLFDVASALLLTSVIYKQVYLRFAVKPEGQRIHSFKNKGFLWRG